MTEKEPVMVRYLVVLLAAAAVVVTCYAMRHTLSSFFLAFIIAYLLDPLVELLERWKIRRLYGMMIIYLLLGTAILFATVFLLPFVLQRWESLLRDLPVYVQKVRQMSAGWKLRWEPLSGSGEWQWLTDRIAANADKAFGKLGAGIYVAASAVVFNLFNLLLAPILVFFMLFYKKEILREIKEWLPERNRHALIELGREINQSIGGYIRGQIVVSAIVAALSTAALFALDVDYPLLNGIFAGIASILPFVGVILALLPPLFFAYAKFQSAFVLLKVIASFAVIYFLEGYVIKPVVFKKAMELNPLLTVLVVMALGELFGFWGILLAIPIASAAKIFIGHLRAGKLSLGL